MRRLFRLATGVDLEAIHEQRVFFDLVMSTDHAAWLYRNRTERMDATVPGLFDRTRQEFHLARYRFAASRAQGMSVADVACGVGYGTRMIRVEGGAASCVGVDIDPQTIAYARETHGAAAVSFVQAAAEDTGLTSGEFDLVVSFETIEHVAEPTRLLEEFYRLLRPNGVLIISTPNDWALEDSPFHLQQYTAKSFGEVLEGRFEIDEWWAQNSGSPTQYNRGQPPGLVRGTPENLPNAEVFVVVCRRRSAKSE